MKAYDENNPTKSDKKIVSRFIIWPWFMRARKSKQQIWIREGQDDYNG